MKQLLSCIVLLLCLTSFTFADDCNNPLLSVFGFTSTGSPQSGSGLKYCKSLQNGNSCCSANVVNSIQDKANVLAASLLSNMAQRDQALVDAKDNILPRIQASYQRMKDAYWKLLAQLSQNDSPVTLALRQIIVQSGSQEALEGYKESLTSVLGLIIPPLEEIFDAVYNNLATIRNQFKDFQIVRSVCAIELLKLQSSAWCLACDPAYASKGVSGTTISMSNRVCNRLQVYCNDYIFFVANQGGLLFGTAASAGIEILVNLLEKLLVGDILALTSFSNDVQKAQPKVIASEILKPSVLPTGCTTDSCAWVCNSLFKNGKVDEILAVRAGESFNTGAFLENRVLIEEDESLVIERKLQETKRALESNTWDPDQDEAGVIVTFDDDPGNVNSSWLIKMSFMCLAGMFATIFI